MRARRTGVFDSFLFFTVIASQLHLAAGKVMPFLWLTRAIKYGVAAPFGSRITPVILMYNGTFGGGSGTPISCDCGLRRSSNGKAEKPDRRTEDSEDCAECRRNAPFHTGIPDDDKCELNV
jgi:hypothetical protein